MRPALPVLLLLVAAAAAPRGARGCGATCSDPRNLEGGKVVSANYCLVKYSANCDYAEGSKKNIDCHPCDLLKYAQDECRTGQVAKGSDCNEGYVMMPDEDCAKGSTPAASKWKIVVTKASRGVEDLLDGGGNNFNKYFAALWRSSLPGSQNPCKNQNFVQTYLDKAPYTGMAINTVQYRSRHQFHAHIGMAKDQLHKGCVDVQIRAGAVTKARRWSDMKECDFLSPLSGKTIRTQVWLRLEKVRDPATSVPKNVGTLITQAAKLMRKAGMSDSAINDFTAVTVTGAKLNGETYFAVLIFNIHKAWAADKDHLSSGSVGDHVMLVSSPPPKP
ncbi:hypothetical protein Rsub_00981 [Raphidocelis subcapitata]|uniref:Chitin-binding type-4 domain-containing protein n=1 Tax=Raphidocelis subcapitata TaxID=307507 RepID=A0A2V0NMB4_9CHLO|nr:hypothetical protein Rsub_00981 [Raphidocelis subcapitata]|eukprot:GBF88269.1 hypothetical protein Rsub_00981 [Raphidocelis subcapitata]